MKDKKIKHDRSNTPVAKLLYSYFPLDAIYSLCMDGMSMNSSCEKVDGKPDELTWDEAMAIPDDLTSLEKDNIRKFQKALRDLRNDYQKRTGEVMNILKGLTETEYYAVWYVSGIWYRD